MNVISEVLSTGRERLEAATRATRLIFLVSGIGMASWAPMVPYAKARLGLDDAGLGLVLLAFGGGSMLSMPLVGLLTHRYGNREVISVAGLLLCVAVPLLAIVPSVVALTVTLLYFGAMLGAVDVAMNAHAVEVERRDGRALMSGFHGLFSIWRPRWCSDHERAAGVGSAIVGCCPGDRAGAGADRAQSAQ